MQSSDRTQRRFAAAPYRRAAVTAVIATVALQLFTLSPLRADNATPAAAAPAAPAPAGRVAPPSELYRLAAGDEVSISVLPQKTYDCGGVLLPDGMLHLKGVGPIKAAGLTLSELQEQIYRVLSEKLVSPRVTATISRLHPQDANRGTITLAGGVVKSGPLALTDGLRVRKALELIGGVTKNADLTRVQILHKDLTRTTVDVSTAERISDPAHNCLLLDGDSIEVPVNPIKTATVRGAVTRPGTVELDGDSLRLSRVLEAAGGTTREADLGRIIVVHSDLSRGVSDLSTVDRLAEPAQNVSIRNGDVIEVPAQAVQAARAEMVRITGQVANPGQYPFRAGMALEDLIQAAGKPTSIADGTHIQIQQPGQAVRIVDLTAQLKLGLNGKVVLAPDDEVFVPEQKDTVVVFGAVARAGQAPLKPNQNIMEFFTQNGPELVSMLDPARVDLSGILVIRKGEENIKVNLKDAIAGGKSRQKQPAVTLKSGDMIFLPPAVQKGPKKGPLSFLENLGPLGLLMSIF